MMEEKELDFAPRYSFQAYHLTETLKLKDIDRLFDTTARNQSATKLVYQQDEESFFFIYRFGSVIFFNVDPEQQRAVIEKIRMVVGQKSELLTSEEFAVEIRHGTKNSVGFERAMLDKLTIERIELLALILAQSTALEYFELKVDKLLRETGDIGQALQQRGKMERSASDIKRFIGQCITTKQDLVASLYLLDKPDETWDDQMLDTLYRDAVEMFELKDRYKTVDYKLRMIQENLELIADLLQNRHANFLEWAIIVLIAVEIVLFCWQLFFLK
jgi:required for meiotic nuclear division protein 1